MSVVVRLLLTSFYYSISSTLFLFFHFACPHLFYEKIILVLNKFIKKTLHKFYNCIRKGFFEVTILNQVITMQIMNFYLIRNGHFACPLLIYGKRILVLSKFIKNTAQVL